MNRRTQLFLRTEAPVHPYIQPAPAIESRCHAAPPLSRRVRRRCIAFVTKGRGKMAATNSAHAQQAKLPFVKTNDRDRIINWWNVKPTGKWVQDFAVGRRYALKFWEVCGSGQTFALEFQQIILGMLSAAKNAKGPIGYSGHRGRFSAGGRRAFQGRDPRPNGR